MPLILIVLLALVASVMGAEPWAPAFRVETPAGQALRGFGRVDGVSEGWQSPAGRAWVLTYRCENPARAATLAGKFLADLDLSPGVAERTLAAGAAKVPVRTAPGGAVFAGCVDGAVARLLCADSEGALAAFLAAKPALAQGAVQQEAYPTYLDRFDRWGWGWYGLGGYQNVHGWMELAAKHDGKKGMKDPLEDFDFAVKHGFRFEPWLDPAGNDNSDGLVKNSESEWQIRRAREQGLPLSTRVYGVAGGADWTARRFPEYMEQPASFLTSGWHGDEMHWKSQPHFSWFRPDIHRYIAVKTMELIRPWAQEPHLMGWMHPHGELAHDEWYDMHDDYSVAAHRHWRQYLQKQGYDLAAVSRMFGRQAQPFRDWEQVPVPESATFAGLPGQVLDLAGDWWARAETAVDAKPDDAWWKLPAEERYAGLKGRWQEGAIDPALWRRLRMPGGDEIYAFYGNKKSAAATTWFRRTCEIGAAQLARKPVYLYWFPMSHGGIHSGARARYHDVFVNGAKAGEIGAWGALDVTALLKPGANEVALRLHGTLWNGRVFLSTEAPRVYPYLGKDANQLWITWHDWHKDAKFDAWRDILDGMRQVDPDRPIKFMAPIKFGEDRWLQLATRWGGFGHFTGEGMWYFPWYKRYSYLYNLPATSETAGPANNLADQFDSFRRTFLAGLNGHDAVFQAVTYTRVPELRKFWEDHNPVLKQMGRYDLHGEQVLLYRSTKLSTGLVGSQPHPGVGEATRPIQSPWNWDLGRGTLQTLGQSYCYLDDGGLADGKMNGYKVMIDGGNEMVSGESIAAIRAWVEAGGTFVTLPFTGRSTLLEPDAWPVRALTGCEVARVRPVGQGTVTVAAGQKVLARHAGRTFPDRGRCMDWIGNQLDLYGTELKPGPGCEVLATFDNGAPAIVRRQLGRGAVIALGTCFWRSSQDRQGVWWPEEIETSFIEDLLAGIGYPAAPCVADDRLVWPQPYRSNNGLDLVSVLVSWNDAKDVETTIRLRLPRKPAGLVSYGVDGEKPLPFTWADGEAVARIAMPAKEVKVVRATGCLEPFDAVSHWWGYQQRIWHELAKPAVDFSPYTRGKWADPTVDLRHGASLATAAPAGDAWQKPGFAAAGWKPCDLEVLTLQGAQAQQPAWVRKAFTVPAAWAAAGGQVRLINGAWSGRQYLGQARLWLNGSLLHDLSKDYNYVEYDLTRQLLPGENVLAWEFAPGADVLGFLGSVYLYHDAPPLRSIDLAGRWSDGAAAGLDLPGKGRLAVAARSVAIPREWQGRYQVRLRLEGNQYSANGAFVNGRMARRHHHRLGEIADVDITAHLRFGEDNRIELLGGPDWDLRVVRLDLHPALDGD